MTEPAPRSEPTSLPGVVLVHLESASDQRGATCTLFTPALFCTTAPDAAFTQLSHSRSQWGVVRGLSVQPPGACTAVRVARGQAFLAVVDLRRDSPTFGKSWWRVLRSVDSLWLMVPSGCAWGMQALDDGTELEALHTATAAGAGQRILWNDPAIGIPWPLPARWLGEEEAQAATLAKWMAGR